MQCGHFNNIPYKGKFYKWEAVINRGEQITLDSGYVAYCYTVHIHGYHNFPLFSCLFFLFAGNPCELHCHPLNEHFSEKMQDSVIDGTPCHEGNKSRDMCINGVCKVSVITSFTNSVTKTQVSDFVAFSV